MGIVLKKRGTKKTRPTQDRDYSTTRCNCDDAPKPKGHIDEDTDLILRMADGDIEAFGCIYSRYCPVLRNFLASYNDYHISSDDFIQEVFTRLWQRRKSFKGESLFITYLLGIARNVLNEKIRQSHKIARIKDLKQASSLAVDSNSSGLSQPEAEFYINELDATLKRIKTLLTAEQQQALEAYQAVDVSLVEISRKLGCSYGALRNRIKRARRRSDEILAHILEDR
jgi:RNA polymerase sigma-70 factor (ECF subfamily)